MVSKRRLRRRTCAGKVGHKTIEAARMAKFKTSDPSNYNVVKEGLLKLPETSQHLFRRMYSPKDLNKPI
jgi:hypothetical protein